MSEIDLLIQEIEQMKERLAIHGLPPSQAFKDGYAGESAVTRRLMACADEMRRELKNARLSRRNMDKRSAVDRWRSITSVIARTAWGKVRTKNGLGASIGIGTATIEKRDSYVMIRIGHMWKFKVFDAGLNVADSLNGPVFVASAIPKSSAFMREVGVDCYEALVADSSKSRQPETGFLFSWKSPRGQAVFYHSDFKRGCVHVRNKIVGEIASLME